MTASWISRGSVARSSRARLVRTSSGKSELAPHLGQAAHSTGLHVLLALAQCPQSLVVLQDLERLLDGLELRSGDQDGRRTAVPRDHDVLVPPFQLVQELAQGSPGLREGNDLRHAL